jgi:hypothetical protein
MQEVLVDGSEFGLQDLIEDVNDLLVAAHGGSVSFAATG